MFPHEKYRDCKIFRHNAGFCGKYGNGSQEDQKIHWLAISEENILNYFHKNSKIKARLKILSKSDNRAKELFDKIWS